MNDYVNVDRFEDTVSIAFYVDNDEIIEVGDMLNEICEDAYMNGENWGILLEAWLTENAPELLEGLDPDPEAGMYAAYYYDAGDEEVRKAERLAEIIKSLINDPEKLCDFVREHADSIEWD